MNMTKNIDVQKNKQEYIFQSEIRTYQQKIKMLFKQSADLVEYSLHLKKKGPALLYYFEGLTDCVALKNNVVIPLLEAKGAEENPEFPFLISAHITNVDTWNEVSQALLSGQSILFIEYMNSAYIIQTKGGVERSIEEPQAESVIKGSHDGFVESAATNIGLIRRYIPSVGLQTKQFKVGKQVSLPLYLIYLDNMVNKEVLHKVEIKVQKIQTETEEVIHVGELSTFIQEDMWTPFPQTYVSERPDAIIKHILNGKIAIVLERSPSVMVVPIHLMNFFHTVDDYNMHWSIVSFFKILRMVGFILAMLLPAVYIAIINYHFEIIPLDLYLSVANSRIKVPFSPLVEALIMEFTIEMLREAGVRLPQPIGQTIGIVGGIVIGQAAVQAGLVSNIMVIVVSITAISSFIVPNYDLSSCIRLIRFPMMILAYYFGIVGVISGVMLVIAHLVTITSFGEPYTTPLAPFVLKDWKDTLIRLPSTVLQKQTGKKYVLKEKKFDSNEGNSDE
ncbi:spore germination protein [Bacillus cereus]|uniref:spore germination protein n=1 Tax=Bacillus cereus TaxID=1396 RepID=UPI000312FD4A|nr:spore germination protein [Bacillus cereus]MDR4293471.1 spore germination protein [Bacillus cereus]